MGTAIARAARWIARDVRRRNGLLAMKPMLAALCAAGVLVACQSVGDGSASDARASRRVDVPPEKPSAAFLRIEGSWSYSVQCGWGGWGHSASLDFLSESGGIVHGRWSDSNSLRGEAGEFQGRWRGNKLFLRFCRIDVYDDDPEECPNYGVENAYVARHGQEVLWYRSGGGADYSKYVELRPFVERGNDPVDESCDEED
jgi:hypothetical protein